jgi:uracil-DNA glycosylase family 4
VDPYKTFDSDLRSCRRCESYLARCPVDPCTSNAAVKPRPIVSGIRPKPILLVGQAPGLTEYESGKPFQGPAGQKIREIFRMVGVADFDSFVYSSAVVKCYPGRKYRKKNQPSSGSEDRVPTTAMVKNCRPFLERQIALVDPQIIVTLGSFPLKAYLQLSGKTGPAGTLDKYVGTSQVWGSRLVVFFPHTSGGARWLNSEANKALFVQAQQLLRTALAERGIQDAQ